MPPPAPLLALTALLAATLAGCVGPFPPGDPRTPAHPLPLGVENARASPVHVRLHVLDASTGLALHASSHDVDAGQTVRVDAPALPPGAYALRAHVDHLQRERVVTFHPDAAYYRFVVHGDAIAFQEA